MDGDCYFFYVFVEWVPYLCAFRFILVFQICCFSNFVNLRYVMLPRAFIT
jgi:hypothetical protein